MTFEVGPGLMVDMSWWRFRVIGRSSTSSYRENIIREIFDAISTRNAASIADYLHDDIITELPYPPAGVESFRHGKESCMSGLVGADVIFRSFALSVTDIYDIPDRDTIIVEFTSIGIVDVSGTDWNNRYIGVFVFKDGRVILWREYMNPMLATQQLEPFMAMVGASQ